MRNAPAWLHDVRFAGMYSFDLRTFSNDYSSTSEV
jgi:hypothetical protein